MSSSVRSPHHPALTVLLWLAAAVLLALGAVSHLAWHPFRHWLWSVPLYGAPQLALGGLLLVALGWRLQSRGLAVVALLGALAHAALLWPQPAPAVAKRDASSVVIAGFNLHREGAEIPKLADWLRDEGASFALLTELPANLQPLLEATKPRYTAFTGNGSPFDVLLLSDWPLRDVEIDYEVTRWLPVLTAVACDPQQPRRCLRIVGLHTARPLGENAILQRRQLDRAAALVTAHQAREPLPLVLLGDCNAPPWSPQLRQLAQAAGLVNAAAGSLLWSSWPTLVPHLGLPIDQIFVGADVGVVARWVGPDLGSDHLPVAARIALPVPGK